MRLIDIIPKVEDVRTLEPEELAFVMIKQMNDLIANGEKNLFHIGNYCNGESDQYVNSGHGKVNRELTAAWGYLTAVGLLAVDPGQFGAGWYFLTNRARKLRLDGDFKSFRVASQFPRGLIHPVIEKESFPDFLRGDYESSVFKAFKAVEVAIRRAIGGGDDLYGKDLMLKAFHAETGVLTDASEPSSERQALQYLFVGAIGRFKNPSSHREVNFAQAEEVIEAIQFASLLMRIVIQRESRREET